MIRHYTLLLAFCISSLAIQAQTFYTEDFSAGIPAGWNNVDYTGNGVIWRTTTTGALDTAAIVDSELSPAGTTAANGYLILDSDSAGQALTENSVLTSTAINCSGYSNVHLSFNEYFAQYLTSTGTVAVSNDNATWVDVHLAHSGLGLNQATPNPNLVEIDISAVADGQATVYIRFHYLGEWDYWWFVDDVKFFVPPPTDLAVASVEMLNTEYTLIPHYQAHDMTLAGAVHNSGGSGTTGGTALMEVIETVSSAVAFTESISLPALAAGSSYNVTPTGVFQPQSAGNYKVRITVNISGDGNSSNDILESAPIAVSDSVYARDDGNFAGTLGLGVGAGQDAITGQNFRVHAADYLTSLTFFLADGFGAQPTGTPVYFTIHPQASDSVNPDGATVVATSETLLVAPGTIPSGGAYFTLTLQGGAVALSPGLYYVGIHETDSMLTIGYSTSIYTPAAVWVHWNSIPTPPAVNGWARGEDFTNEVAYMIRANFGSSPDGIEEQESLKQIVAYPNPSTGNLFLRNTGTMQSLNVEVINALGACVYSGTWEGESVYMLDLKSRSHGLYTVRVSSGTAQWTGKIILAK